jgi:CHASE3 domain sensor protein
MIRKTAIQFGTSALLVCMALNAYLAVNRLRQMQNMAALTLQSSMIQASISGALKDLTDMETGQRGYLLTGNQSYLQPYSAAQDRIGKDLASLRTELATRPDDERTLESQLEFLANSKQVEMGRTIDLRRQGYRHRSFMLVGTNEGNGHMDEARRVVSSLSSAENNNFARLDKEGTVALNKALWATIVGNGGLLVLAAFLFGLIRHHERLLAEDATKSRQELAARESQLIKLTSALSGQARFNITALNTNSRLLLEHYGGFLPRQGHEYAEQMKDAATEMERLRQDLVGDAATAA